ncbi:MAG: DNA recombination protein RmuC [Actinomycetota bacterium]
MEPVLVISLLIAFLAVAALGAGTALFVVRSRTAAEGETVQRLAAELAARHDAQVDGVVERVVSVAGDSFDSRLQTGTAELEHRRQAIDDRLEGVVKSLADKVDSVDKLVAERVGGMSDTVGERVGGMSKSLGHQVTTMNTELGQLRMLVGQLQKERAQQHGQFVESLEAATRQQKVLAETTQHLREALASPQARGQWGERMAEDVLRSAGMREGINYRKQRAIEGGTRPDFTFLLPDDQHLHMDVKFPVANYLRYLEAPSDAEAAILRDRFLKDVRERVKELHGRGYAASDTTVGYLLLFIPNESVYGFIHENDTALLDDALGKKVVLCSPTTLFAVLGVVRQAMDTFAVERKTDEILQVLAGFGAQWSKFSDQVDKVERHLATLTNSVNDLAGPRRNQLERQLSKIETIRARSIDPGANTDHHASPDTPAALPAQTDASADASTDGALPFLREVTDRNAS